VLRLVAGDHLLDIAQDEVLNTLKLHASLVTEGESVPHASPWTPAFKELKPASPETLRRLAEASAAAKKTRTRR
jgi:hypothetical protein